MKALRFIISLAILIGMSLFIGYGYLFQSGPGIVAQSMVPFWGKFVWTDLLSTFVLFSIIIFVYERNWLVAMVMLIVINVFGAAAIAAWLLWRGPDLYRRIGHPHT